MYVQIYGSGMDDQIEASLDRPLNPRSRKRIIANRNDLVLACDFGDRFQIDQLEQRIARSLDPHHPGVRLDRASEIFRIGQIDVGKIEISRAASNFLE